MSQSKLHSYFHFPAKPTSSIRNTGFLDLPFLIRRRVYLLAGLVRTCPIELNHATKGGEALYVQGFTGPLPPRCRSPEERFPDDLDKWEEERVDCGCRPLPIQLLHVSRAISKESSHILYSENSFEICRSRDNGLIPLFLLAGSSLKSMTSLSIRLNVCSYRPRCEDEAQRRCDYHQTCEGGARGLDKPLDKISRNDKTTLSEWKYVCARLSSNIQSSHLRLFVICDTANYEVATEVVRPLAQMPKLQACSIRLGQTPNHELRRLAQATVYQLTQKFVSNINDRPVGIHIPAEIQMQILGLTELIAPEVLRWESPRRLRVADCCGQCTDALEACCCSLQHAAFSERCTCWKFPMDLFLTSSSLHEAATRIFYRGNIFAISLTCLLGEGISNKDVHSPMLEFLTSLPSQALPHLRSIQCVFPTLSPDFLHRGSDARAQLLRTVAFISDHLQLSKLTLTVDMMADLGYGGISDIAYMSLADVAEMVDEMWIVYQRVIETLVDSPLKGRLKNLFVRLSWPQDGAENRAIRNTRERILEQRVMGEDYDSSARGKFGENWWRRWTESDEV